MLGRLTKLINGANQSADDSQDVVAKELPPPKVMVSKQFFTDTEMNFYRVLTQCLDEKTTILAQVSMQQLFYVLKGSGQKSWRNKIQSKSIDFLLCDTATLRPLLGIELDDATHEQPERVARDKEVDRVFASANLQLLHIAAQRQYDTRKALAADSGKFEGSN